MKNRIITISRQFGSAGRTIGKEAAARLGISCYDEELIKKIAQKSGLDSTYIKERGEYMPSSNWWENVLSDRDYMGRSLQDALWGIQHGIILELAEKEPCVIVGRCADYILKGKADLMTVFIHASLEKRAERIVQVYGEKEDAPEKRLKDKDRRRQAYYQIYTNTEWGIARNYNLVLDSGVFGIEKCVDVICALYDTARS